MAEYSHSCVLFIDASDDRMSFFVRPTVENRQTLKKIIEFGGGIVAPSPSNGVIQLIGQRSKVLNIQDGQTVALVQYIYDCVEKNQMLDIEPYLIKVNSEDVSDLDDVSNDGEDDMRHVPYRTSANGTLYTEAEDVALLRYILNNSKKYLEMPFVAFCNDASSKRVVSRTGRGILKRLNRFHEQHEQKNSNWLGKLNLSSDEKAKLIKLVSRRKQTVNRSQNYTQSEDLKMIHYIMKNRLFSSMSEMATFEAMRDSTQLSRTANGLHKRFNKILKKIHSYDLPPEVVQQFVSRTSKLPSISTKKSTTRSQSIDAHLSSDSSLQARTISDQQDTNPPAKKKIFTKRLFTDSKLEQRLDSLDITPTTPIPPKTYRSKNQAEMVHQIQPEMLELPRQNGIDGPHALHHVHNHHTEESSAKKQKLSEKVIPLSNGQLRCPTQDAGEVEDTRSEDSLSTVAFEDDNAEIATEETNRIPCGSSAASQDSQDTDFLSNTFDSFDASLLKRLQKCTVRLEDLSQKSSPLFEFDHVNETVPDIEIKEELESDDEELPPSEERVGTQDEIDPSDTEYSVISHVDSEEVTNMDVTLTGEMLTTVSTPETTISVPVGIIPSVVTSSRHAEFFDDAVSIVKELDGVISNINCPAITDAVEKDLKNLKSKLHRKSLSLKVQTIMQKPQLTIKDKALLLKYLCHLSGKSPRDMFDELMSSS